MATALTSLPISTQFSRSLAKYMREHLRSVLPDHQLPSLTQSLILGQSESKTLTLVAIALVISLAFSGWKFAQLPDDNRWRHTGPILITTVGFCLSLLVILMTFLAGTLPYAIVIEEFRS